MKHSAEILSELMIISPLLAGLEKTNVFSVPEGYFNELYLRITDYAILNNISPEDNINKRNIQQVPRGYFDSLSDTILAKVKVAYPENAEEELHKLSHTLFGLKAKKVFMVPEGYFDRLGDVVLNLVKDTCLKSADEELYHISKTLYALKDKNVFSVPRGYFESLSDAVLDTVNKMHIESAEELRGISAILYSIKDINVFTVPEEYFESFAININRKLRPGPAKVVTMKKRNSWLKYAAAAVVAGIITITSLQIFKGSSHNSSTQYASLPGYIQASFQYKTEADLNAGIAKLDDADIAKYLEKNGNVLDNELLTNNTDVSELPSATDYLTDENTLNEYLDKIDSVSKTTP